MAVSVAAIKRIQPARPEGLLSVPTGVAPLGGSQTFLKGAILINSSGNLVEAADDPEDGTIVGVAAEPAVSASAGVRSIGYYPAIPTIVFMGVLVDAVAESHTLVATNRWAAYALKKTTAGIWFLDENDTTDIAVRVVGFKDAIGTNKAVVYFRFLSAETIFGV